jgi:glycosyltransferase involved in cell wall biosynthesis
MIIVDDGSTDNTQEVVRSFRNKKIEYIRHERNRQVSAARNTGIQIAKGKYIALLDDDDEWFPTKLEKQVNKFEESTERTGVIYTGILVKSGKTAEILGEMLPTLRGKLYADLIRKNFIPTSSSMIRKTCLQEVGVFDENITFDEDWDLWIRVSRRYEFNYIPEVLVSYYIHGIQITSKLDVKIRGRERLIKKHYLDFSKYPPILANHLKRVGKWHILLRNVREGRKYFWHSIKTYPFKNSSYFHFLLSLLPNPIYKNVTPRYYLKKEKTLFY